jgi:hypothetical protein
MIRYALVCDNEDEFEAWFRSSADYDVQETKGLLECPHCGSKSVRKAPMAPAVARKDRDRAPSREEFQQFAAKVRSHIKETHDYVGESFADEARKMHEGDADHRPIWGEAKAEEAKALVEEGVPVAPLPAPFAPTPPRKVN